MHRMANHDLNLESSVLNANDCSPYHFTDKMIGGCLINKPLQTVRFKSRQLTQWSCNEWRHLMINSQQHSHSIRITESIDKLSNIM